MKLTTGLGVKTQTGSLLFQYLACITGCLSTVCTGMHFGWPSPSLPQLLRDDSPIQMSPDDGSWMAVMPCLGGMLGSIVAALLVDRIGRKSCMMITTPVYFLAWILVAFASSVQLLNIARFLAGISDGIAFTALPMYFGELADPKIRGLLGSSIPATLMLGQLLINIIGSYLDIRMTALVSSIVPVIHFFTFCFMPESPYYLIMVKKLEAAKKSLQTLKGTDDVSTEVKRLDDAVREDLESVGHIWDLFTIKSNRKAFIIMAVLRAAQQLGGGYAITFYINILFIESGTTISPDLGAIVYFIVQLITATVASFLVDKVGRRPLLILSITGSGFALCSIGLHAYLVNNTNINMEEFSFVPLLALLCYVVIFNCGMGTIPVLLLGELFPTSVKAFALCLSDIYMGLTVTLASKFLQHMMDWFGMHVPFFTFTGICVIGLVFIVGFVPETKGKTLEDIQSYLKGDVVKDEKSVDAA